ncbi:penicillin-binding protein 1A [Marinibactrum halimedae]|uniref:Penicillin-binding protein 1A n=1 Tax=Marinibactrum halimedae TaxID=1444977 RepID=A0AA37T3D7_9GAMM|nr:penicillin-binding protein 1A [Marinibactrum halimedae]MCD9459746.1 penicillin-binding protein 1A [Marinibactrum halimedae]GLS24497.1 hypothetical protein GCM10007877_02090 [Marinibactrum halimedae]
MAPKPLIPIEKMPKKRSVFALFFWFSLAGIGAISASLSGMYLYLSPKLPEVETLRETKFQIPLRIYTKDGKLIGEFGEKRRSPITYEQIPETFEHAILAAEDDRFYSHNGVDIKGLMRAASQILQTGEIQGGGSTITMQVARNFFLNRKQVFTRKFNEILLSLQIEKELTKEEILTLYINKIYLGNRAYGFQAAAQIYYGKDIGELSLAQYAMIAGLPKAPSAFNPVVNPSRALIRRNWILGRMLELGYIDNERYESAISEPVVAKNHGTTLDLYAPYIAEMARKEMLDRFGLDAYTDGYEVYLTIDSTLQMSAQKAIVNGLNNYDQRHGYRGPEASLPTKSTAPWSQVNDPTLLPESYKFSQQNAEVALTDEPLANDETASELETIKNDFKLDLTTGISSIFDRSLWLERLKDIPIFADQQPAAVVSVHNNGITVLLKNDEIIAIARENGLNKVRRFVSENYAAEPYKTLEEFLKPGDVVRVYEKQGQWFFSQIPSAQGALVALDPNNGAIRALVGGYDFNQSHFNRVTQATRQPGSNFKPFVYTAALENGFTPASIVNDAPIVFDDTSLENTWRPENSSGKFYGPTRLRTALYNSRNLVSIRVLRSIGIDTAINAMDRFGFDKNELPRDLSLALGSHALTPIQVATGYASFANGGFKVSPFLIERITNAESEITFEALPETACNEKCQQDSRLQTLTSLAEAELEAELKALESSDDISPEALLNNLNASDTASENQNDIDENTTDTDESIAIVEAQPTFLPRAERVMSPQVNYLINSMLRDVIKRGTGRKALSLKRSDLAGKTGTTNGPTDAWFSGYNSKIVATTWVGFDQNQLLGLREFGGSAALPIWIEFMQTALKGVPEDNLLQPDGIVSVKIDPETGLRARPGDPDAIFEMFREENTPELVDDTQNGDEDIPSHIAEELF